MHAGQVAPRNGAQNGVITASEHTTRHRQRSCCLTPSTPASYIKRAATAALSLNTQRALFQAPTTTNTMPHACRAVTDVISSYVLAGERGGHAGGELAAALITVIHVSDDHITDGRCKVILATNYQNQVS